MGEDPGETGECVETHNLRIKHRDTEAQRPYFEDFKKLCVSVTLCLIHF